MSGDSNEENVPFFLWPKHLPWRLFRTTYGYHRIERACRFAAIPKIHVTPITEAILTKSKATLELCCCLVTCLALWNNQNVNNPGFKIQICLRCCVGHASRRTNSWIGKAQTDRRLAFDALCFNKHSLYCTHLPNSNDMKASVSQSKEVENQNQSNRQNEWEDLCSLTNRLLVSKIRNRPLRSKIRNRPVVFES